MAEGEIILRMKVDRKSFSIQMAREPTTALKAQDVPGGLCPA
ncbi:hypothetical protein ACG873_30035 [Mesorhizobium sp. AaZ16]